MRNPEPYIVVRAGWRLRRKLPSLRCRPRGDLETLSPMKTFGIALLLVSASILAGCASNAPPQTSQGTTPGGGTGTSADLLGSGSTFVAPLMDKWRTAFHAQNPGVTISYTGGGSGKGRTDVTNKLVDFAGSDAPMKDAEI